MLKRFICGAFMIAALCGSSVAPAQADELYVRNRPFKDVYFSGGTAYVPVDGFLKAARVPWSVEGDTVVVGKGDSPALGDMESVTLVRDGQSTKLSGIVRGGKLYVSTKELAKLAGYKVVYNRSTGVVDVVKSRLTSNADEKAAEEVAAANQAEEEARDAAWQARVEKARAARKAKEEAAQAAADEDMESDGEGGEDVLEAKGDPDVDASDTTTAKVDGKEDAEFDQTDKSEDEKPAKEDEEKKPPPKADLVVLSADADPNNYDGTVVFKAVLQNQGYATATGVTAKLKVIGPDDKVWVQKTLYHADITPDGRWVITENYRHRAASAIPRGNYDVQVVPSFQSAAPKE